MRKFLLMVALVAFGIVSTANPALCQTKAGPDTSPQRGGILQEIRPDGPKVLGYFPEMGPVDEQSILPAVEKLMEYNYDKQLVPLLAESVSIGKDEKSITFKLRKGIKFHDGSEFNAAAVVWNYQLAKSSKRLQYDAKLLSVEEVDNLTVRLHITNYTNQLLHSFGWVPIFSKQAWDKAGGGDVEKAKAWARTNAVGTGPFKLVEYKRDHYMKWTRNENYWQPGKPHLDGIVVHYVPDPVTASAMMQAKEADMWYQAPVREVSNLEKQGLLSVRYVMPRMLFFNNKDGDSKFQNKKLREAVEYAIDKPAIAKALGFGYYIPMTQTPPPGYWGYDPIFKGRPYDPAKAKQLLVEAGYPNGVKVKLLAQSNPPYTDEVQAIKRYLDEVGITVDPDLADPGRFFGSFWRNGWQDKALSVASNSANKLVSFHRFFGPDPMANMASFKRPPELIALAEKSLTLKNENEQKEITKQLARIISDEALAVPLYLVPTSIVHQPYVHINWLKIQMVTRHTGDEWMEKH
jgi:peptide/nickel transport system substrate-binding protein